MRLSDETALQAAFATRNATVLVSMYKDAALHFEAVGDAETACFYMTQAYVWALDAGHPETDDLHRWLKARGREE